MEIIRIGVDLAKNVFQVRGVDHAEKTVWQKPFVLPRSLGGSRVRGLGHKRPARRWCFRSKLRLVRRRPCSAG